MVKDRYSELSELEFVKIEKKYVSLLNEFQTWQKDLKDFLIEDAIKNQETYISTTYIIFDKENFTQHKDKITNLTLMGYITILNDNISLDANLKRLFKEKGVLYKSLPALKIGRLCVDDRYQKRCLGKLLLTECIRHACSLNKKSACRFITLDAKRHPDKEKDSLHFYKKYGFEILEHKDKNKDELIKQTSGTTPMYLDLIRIIATILKKTTKQ
jgi:GNAT superfamily N-acetyltransferase